MLLITFKDLVMSRRINTIPFKRIRGGVLLFLLVMLKQMVL